MIREEVIGTNESWGNWRALAGYVYLVICLFDFVIMPAAMFAGHQDTKEFIKDLSSSSDKAFFIQVLDRTHTTNWTPTTLTGGGLFHISFGAILTGVAVTKGQERREVAKNNKR